MKRSIIGALALSALLMSGCMDDFLDRNPYGSIDETTFFTEPEHADLAAMACYAKLQKLNAHWGDAQLELGMTGDFSPKGFKDASAFYLGTFNPSESNVVSGIWKRAYEGIALCNKNIEGVTGMGDIIDAGTRDKYLAEMRFIRAFWYFRLIQFYGDVPLRSASVEDPMNTEQVQVPATPKETILKELILPDLKFASEKLPEAWDDAYAHRATKGAAFAYLCEVNLYMQNYDDAIRAGEEVEKRNYALEDDPGCVLRVDKEDSKEIIFSIGIASGISTYREFYFGTIEDLGKEDGRIMRGDSYSGDYFYPSEDFVDCFQTIDGKDYPASSYYTPVKADQWKNRDPRFDATFFTPLDVVTTTTNKTLSWQQEWLVNTETGYDIQKRGVYYGEDTWNMRVDMHMMRLPRVYLHMAEAYALKANPDFGKCSEYIEKVRGRARNFALANKAAYVPAGMADEEVLPPYTINSVAAARQAIDYESRVEFFSEDCIRYYDLKRWGTLKEVWPKVVGGNWEDKLIDLPYPANELSANPSLTQHGGWGN
ncbi:MAG: RagB/SusD family nutrient uptake outer membrane protein [Parabacteroides sp.]|nr:RagB/SusD family nutrient uptake outer membrane protein [Parabacteroides sp.]